MEVSKAKASIKRKRDPGFFRYQLAVSQNFIRVFIVIIGLFNMALLLPDTINLHDSATRLAAASLRIVFVLMVIALLIWFKKIKTFQRLAFFVTVCELAAVSVFLIIYGLYDSPDFMIQLLGVLIIIIAVFVVPNLFINMLTAAILIAAAFFCIFVFYA